MKQELFEYATYTLMYRHSKNPNNRSILFSDVVMGVSFVVILIISSLLCLLTKPLLWGILFLLLVLSLLYNQRETDMYTKALFIDGIFLVYLGVFFSDVLLRDANTERQHSLVLPLLLTVFFSVFTYEIIVVIRIKQRYYSHKKNNISTNNNKKVNTGIISMMSSLGAITGLIMSRLYSKSIPLSIGQTMFIICTGFMFLCGFVLFQKYFILRIKNTETSSCTMRQKSQKKR